jgi:signal peptidase I
MAKQKGSFFKSFISFVGAVSLLLAIRWMLIEPYVIPSGSMIPTLLIHDHILVNKAAYGVRKPFSKEWIRWFGRPERGDIVVFRSLESDNHFMIKRVVGLPGDEIKYSANGELIVNGNPLPRDLLEGQNNAENGYYAVNEIDLERPIENFSFYEEGEGKKYRTILRSEALRLEWDDEPYKVPEGQLFVMGDNRDNSRDSRTWGALPEENLLGKAMFVWLSCDSTLSFAPFLCNPLRLRWRRFFHSIQ